jgi:hypothetical protein
VRNFEVKLLSLIFLFLGVACSPKSSNEVDVAAPEDQPIYTVSGSVDGLHSGTLVLSLNGNEKIALSPGITQWSFSTYLKNAQAYTVSVVSQPSTDVNCLLANANGLVDSGNVTNVSITCPDLQSLSLIAKTNILAPGAQLALQALGNYSNIASQDLTTQGTWSSADPAIASVAADGTLTALAPGTVSIQFSYGSFSKNMSFTVKNTSLSSLALAPGNLDIAAGLSRAVKAIGTYSDGSTQDLTTAVTWSSSATAVATVSNTSGSQGTLKGVSPGTITLTATLGAVSVSKSVHVSSATLVALDITPGYVLGAAGVSQPLRATATLSDASTLDVTSAVSWSSSAQNIATVSTAGLLSLRDEGSATVTAEYNGQSAQVPVTVQAKTISSLALSADFSSLPAGTQENISVIATYSDSSTQDVTSQVSWSVSDTSVIYIVSEAPLSGQARSLNAGTSVVTAALGGKSASLTLTVTTATLSSLRLSPGATLISKGIDLAFKAYGTFSDGGEYEMTNEVTWASSNASYAELSNAADSAGAMTNEYAGSSTVGFSVTATSGSVSGSSAIIITPASLTGLVITPGTVTTGSYSEVQMYAYGQFSDGASTDLTDIVSWSSDTPAVAVISNADQAHGILSALSEGTATLQAKLGSLSASQSITVSDSLPSSIIEQGMGLKGDFYADKVFGAANYKGSRIDGQINFDWGAGTAPLGVGDSFSIRWTGYFLATTTETYTFCTQSDDGARLWVNGTQVINNWTDHAQTKNCGTINLTAGQKYSLQLEFYENGGNSVIELSEKTATITEQIIPRAQLFDH